MEGGILMFSYIRRLGPFLGVQNLKFQKKKLGFKKNEYFFWCEDFVDSFWGNHKTGLVLGVISMHFISFLEVNVQNGDIFLGR